MAASTISSPRAVLICRPNSHPFQDRTVGLEQSVKIGRSVARSRPNLTNAIFDCKVLSRNHALLWYDTGKFYLQDTKSSNGTFINNQRLSKSSEESPPREVSSGDIVQFGVDVMEVTKKVTHGCIVATLQLFLPDGKEAKASSSTMLADTCTTTSVQEIYQLNQFIQEALQREQLIETKLTNMNKLMTSTKEGVDTSWKALIEEDRLLTRVDILERQLEVSHKSMNEDKLRKEVIHLNEDKEKYQAIAKEILRKAIQEKMDSIVKHHDLEMSLNNSQQEKLLLKELCESSAIELKDLAVKYEESQKKSKELVQELSQSAEKYKEEVEALNKKLKDGESLVADRQKLIDSLAATVDLQVQEKFRNALGSELTSTELTSLDQGHAENNTGMDPSSGGDSVTTVTLEKENENDLICQDLTKEYNNVENSQKWLKCALKIEELQEELKGVLREKVEIHERVCQLSELFEDLKAVSNKLQVSEYLVNLIAKVDTELTDFKTFTQVKDDDDLNNLTVYESDHDKGEESEDLDESVGNRRITITPKSVCTQPIVVVADGQKLLEESRRSGNSPELQNGATNSEIQDLKTKLSDANKQVEYYRCQVTSLSSENADLEQRLTKRSRESCSIDTQLSDALFELSIKQQVISVSEDKIKRLKDEVRLLTEAVGKATPGHLLNHQPQPPARDLKKDKKTVAVAETSSQTVHDPITIATERLSHRLMESEEELAIYKEQFQQSMAENSRLERQLAEQSLLAKESNMGALRYMVPLIIFILAILIAFHPSS